MNVHVAQWLGCRESQEDAYAVRHFPHGVLAVVCDGMGGHDWGALASRTAATAFAEAFTEAFTEAFAAAPPPLMEAVPALLSEALNAANAAVGEAFAEQGDYGGTTLLAAYVGQGLLWWVSVGDSPLLLWRQGRLTRLNEDHSLRPAYMEYARRGIFTFEEALREGHSLRSALTGEDLRLVDAAATPRPLLPGDRLVLASDGADRLLLPPTLAPSTRRLLAERGGSLAARLVEACRALNDPEADNVTVLTMDEE